MMKKMIFAALLAGCIGCSNQDDVLLDKEGKVSLSVNLSFSEAKTKSGDDAMTDSENYPKWSQLLLIAKDNTGAIIEEKLVNNEDSFNNTINLIEKSDNNKLIGGTVVAYAVTKDHSWGDISTSNLPVLADSQKDINNWQSSGFVKESKEDVKGIKGKFVNVPYYGSSNITLNGNAEDGHIKLSATVNVVPELGRIQVLDTPNKGGEKDLGNGNKIVVSAIKVTDVYINRIKSGDNTIDIRNKQEVPATGWASNYYASDKPLRGMTDNFTNSSNPTNVGYQIFDGDKPHVIVKVVYQLNDVDKDYTGYLTIQKYTYGSVDKGDLVVAKGKVYDIDLSKLTPSFDQITDEPYDPTVYYDLFVDVAVKDWVKVEVTPEL